MISSNPCNTGIASYRSMGWSPAELEQDYTKTMAELITEAETDCYDEYFKALPFNEWDYIEGEEPSDTHHEALTAIAEADDYAMYDGAKAISQTATEKAQALMKANTARVKHAEVIAALQKVEEVIDEIGGITAFGDYREVVYLGVNAGTLKKKLKTESVLEIAA